VYGFHSNAAGGKIGDVSPACDTGGELDKKIRTYEYNSRHAIMCLSLLWLLIKKTVRTSGSKTGFFMCR
jgi:hypothetical protein